MPYVPPIEVFNDLNQNVYTLYKVIQDSEKFNELKRMLDLTLFSEDNRKDAIEQLKRTDLTDIERAYWFFVKKQNVKERNRRFERESLC